LIRASAERLLAYSQKCTHFSCPVLYQAAEQQFYCPCHAGRFAVEDGRPLSGPPKRPLPRIEVKITGDDITGYEENGSETMHDWAKLATAVDTLVVLMGLKTLPHVVSQLLRHGCSSETPVALIRWGTRSEQETLTGTLSDIVQKAKERKFSSPAVTIIGDVVTLRDRLHWFDEIPLPQVLSDEPRVSSESLRLA